MGAHKRSLAMLCSPPMSSAYDHWLMKTTSFAVLVWCQRGRVRRIGRAGARTFVAGRTAASGCAPSPGIWGPLAALQCVGRPEQRTVPRRRVQCGTPRPPTQRCGRPAGAIAVWLPVNTVACARARGHTDLEEHREVRGVGAYVMAAAREVLRAPGRARVEREQVARAAEARVVRLEPEPRRREPRRVQEHDRRLARVEARRPPVRRVRVVPDAQPIVARYHV
jgi:hypothetical protein